ncbi:MAG: hypothetical protein Q9169_002917 [Polycauliona sp. 2 TL-2023]
MLLQQPVQNLLALLIITVLPQITRALPTEASNSVEVLQLDKRQDSPLGGIQIEAEGCTGIEHQVLRNAIIDASYLAAAGLEASSNFREVPFGYFFKSDIETAKVVGDVLQRVIDAQRGKGPVIYATCKDRYERCAATNGGYTAQIFKPGGRPPLIVICPAGLALRRNPKPCTTKAGNISLGWFMLHQLVIVKSIGGPTFPIIDLPESEVAIKVREKLVDGEDTTRLADAYAHLGSWSYDLGLGYEPWHPDKNCKNRFWSGQFTLRALDIIEPTF